MIQLHKTPGLLQAAYPKLTWRRESSNEIYLTFDDGPHPEITPWVLEELKKWQAKATFFCVGENLEKYPEVAKQITDGGHLIANHTHNHLKGWSTENKAYYNNIHQCEEVIRTLQEKANSLFRPPYGRIKRKQIQNLNSTYELVMWSHLSWDFYPNLNIQKSLRNLRKVAPGSIIVFHDSEKAFNNLQLLLPDMLTYWHSLNYKFSIL